MNTIQKLLIACSVGSLCGIAAGAEPAVQGRSLAANTSSHAATRGCSVRDIVGQWVFATAIGRQMLPGFPPDKDITAIGTWYVEPDGSLSGSFDVTVEDTFFQPGIAYEGSVVVNRDCTGTVTFVTALGAVRTDSIAVVSRGEVLGMSQDPFNLWTYQARRVGYYSRRGD